MQERHAGHEAAPAGRRARDDLTGDPRWTAVCARDARADGTFVYAVRTTGVYCRPSCSARRPRPENVAFHADPDAAERAGFRACKRCRPNEAGAGERRAALVAELCRFIEGSEQAPTLEALGQHAGASRFHVQRMFKSITGLTPRDYARALRAERVRAALAAKPRSVTEAVYAAGYASAARFYDEAHAVLGMEPRRFRAGGDGIRIRSALASSSLGQVLVAATERGVCAILFGDDPAALEQDLERRFPRAERVAGDAAFESLVRDVVALVERPELDTKLPLDLRGTAFQVRVWNALRDIPPGETRTYAELARELGIPSGARAVGRACAENPLAVAVPCHRVLGAGGALSGYRWGLSRKQELLSRERRGPRAAATERPRPIVPGAVVLPGFALGAEGALLGDLERIVAEAAPRHMQTPLGHRMSVAMTNTGPLGWISDERGYRYGALDPETGRAWPALPESFRSLATAAARAAGFPDFEPDACLVNRYEPGARLSLHRDEDERDLTQPIVSVSLGLPAVFLFGGLRRKDAVESIPLVHGDVVVWGGPARLRYHGVRPVSEGEHPLLGRCRINLTFRKAG